MIHIYIKNEYTNHLIIPRYWRIGGGDGLGGYGGFEGLSSPAVLVRVVAVVLCVCVLCACVIVLIGGVLIEV